MTTIRLLLAVCCCLFVQRIVAAEPNAKISAKVTTQREIWQGQRVILAVELWTPGIFSSAPAFDLPKINGVIIVAPEESPVIGNQTEGDVTYTTQRHDLSVYPQRSGTIEIPGISVRFESSAGFGKPTTARNLTTPLVTINVKQPAGFEGTASIVTTDRLTVKESWAPEPGSRPAKVGSAFTRTITIEAHDIPGMLLPDFRLDPPQGLSIYSKPTRVEDVSNRGDLTGRRVEQNTYMCEHPGSFEFPAMTFRWWNRTEKEAKQIELPARSIVVAAFFTVDDSAAVSVSAPEKSGTVAIRLVSGIAVIAAACVGLGRFVLAWGKARNQEFKQSEAAAFLILERDCRSGDLKQIYRSFLTWVDRFQTSVSAHAVDDFFNAANDPQLVAAWNAIGQQVYGRRSTTTISRHSFFASVDAARTRIRRHRFSGERVNRFLPQLNPIAGPLARE